MPIKNFWSLDPGVVIFVDEFLKKYKGKADFYFPFKDTGIDLICVTKNQKRIVTFQVKESRYYDKQDRAWHQVNKQTLMKNKGKVDFYVFLIYFPKCLMESDKKNKNGFEKYFLIVPENDLLKKIASKKGRGGNNNLYDFHFRFQERNEKIIDVRESDYKDNVAADYSNYLDKWELITKKL